MAEGTPMNLAIPVYGSRVMPRFGFTRKIMVVTVEDGRIVSRKRLKMTPETLISLPAVLASERVSVMICGGIHPRFQQAIQGQNIQLVWGVVGEWQDVLQAYLKGTLQSNPTFCLRHGRRRGSRFRERQQRRS
jgi:predicted Fe-Mo cluster-binding NifX family protein